MAYYGKGDQNTSSGGKSVEIAAASAVVQFDMGSAGQNGIMNKLGVCPGTFTLKGSMKKDTVRIDMLKGKKNKTQKRQGNN